MFASVKKKQVGPIRPKETTNEKKVKNEGCKRQHKRTGAKKPYQMMVSRKWGGGVDGGDGLAIAPVFGYSIQPNRAEERKRERKKERCFFFVAPFCFRNTTFSRIPLA